MKMLNIALMMTLMLISGVALAERGSDKDNEIAYPESTSTSTSSETRSFSPSDLIDRNP
ncbi:hypothetical protein [Vreelandella olivaria]|uniref:hypothetical protein n=1 Tax=Vreelandella olivaria TaxID=390919 RepID=UPI00201ECBCE|nr:hypothetical protein [Halomonas olivaria]